MLCLFHPLLDSFFCSCQDPVFRVRKATALNLHKICKVVGDAGIQRLLPAYIRLTQDDVYRVRASVMVFSKACELFFAPCDETARDNRLLVVPNMYHFFCDRFSIVIICSVFASIARHSSQ